MLKQGWKHSIAVGFTAMALFGLAACGSDDESSSSDTTAVAGGSSSETVIVGSANFPGNVLLAEIYAGALESKGVAVERQLNIGNREAYFAAIKGGEIQLLPEYSNAILSFVTKQAGGTVTATNVEEQVAALREQLPDNLTVLDASAAEDKDVLVCNKETAEEFSLEKISDLSDVAKDLVIGAPPEFAERDPFGIPGLKRIYGLEFKEFRPLEIGPPIADALASNAIQCGNLFSAMSIITKNGFVALEDDKVAVPNEAVVPLIATDSATDDVTATLNDVSSKLDTEGLKAMMVKVEQDKTPEADVAAEWLAANGFT